MRPDPRFLPGWHPVHPLLGLIVPLVFLAAIVGLVIWVVLRVTDPRRNPPMRPEWAAAAVGRANDPAVDLVRARYARGEISRDEYLRVAADLGAPAPYGGGEVAPGVAST